MNQNDVVVAQNNLKKGANLPFVNQLEENLYSTVTLVDGQKEYDFFNLREGEQGLTLADTNVIDGSQVPNKESWKVYAVKPYIMSDAPVTAIQLAKIGALMFDGVIAMTQDRNPVFAHPISTLMGQKTLLQSVDTVGESSLNSTFMGAWKLRRPWTIPAGTTYSVKLSDLGNRIDADLDGIRIRLELVRDLEYLV